MAEIILLNKGTTEQNIFIANQLFPSWFVFKLLVCRKTYLVIEILFVYLRSLIDR